MAPQIRYDYLRLRLNVDSSSGVVDAVTEGSPDIWQASNLAVQFAIFRGDELVDVSVYSSVTLKIKHLDDRQGPALMEKTITGAELNQALTLEEWNERTQQHGTFAFTPAETSLRVGDQTRKSFWLVICAIDDAGALRPLGAGELVVVKSGCDEDELVLPPGGGEDFYNTTESDARYVLKTGDTMSGNLAINRSIDGSSGLTLQNLDAGSNASAQVVFDTDDVDGFAGASDTNGDPQFAFGTITNHPVVLYVANGPAMRVDAAFITFPFDRVRLQRAAGKLQLWDEGDNLWRTLSAQGGQLVLT